MLKVHAVSTGQALEGQGITIAMHCNGAVQRTKLCLNENSKDDNVALCFTVGFNNSMKVQNTVLK